MSKRLGAALLLLAAVLVSVVGVVEAHHRMTFGHFVPLTLHADYSVAHADIGIPGISKLYGAHLTNFGIVPRRIERCEFVTDDMAAGVSIGYRLQQWDAASRHWHTVLETSSAYCRPYPLGIIKARLTSKLLWPGQTLSTSEEATGARDGFKGQTMRFAVVGNGREFATASFVIDEQVQRPDVNYRAR
jgi:hypothetical protein